MKLRDLFLYIVLVGVSVYAYNVFQHQQPCAQPITYKVGTFDNSFGISQADFLDALNQAAQIWEKPTGLKLFAYDPHGELPVNLIYDQRQQLTDQNKALTSDISANTSVAQSVKQQFNALKNQYSAAQQTYRTQLDAYNQSLDQYNSEVSYWNSRGGAPQGTYEELTQKKAALQTQQASLETTRTQINDLASQINALIDKYNLLVGHINQTVSQVNQSAGKEFNEGEYIRDSSGERINIYEFSNKQKLVRVLAHELGHALGLDHNSDPNAIMYYLNEGSNEKLTAADIASLKALCKLQ